MHASSASDALTATRATAPWRSAAVILALTAGSVLTAPSSPLAAQRSAQSPSLSTRARQQIAALMAEKRARTPVQRKIGSRLLWAARRHRGEVLAPGLTLRASALPVEADGRVLVDIRAAAGAGVKAVVERLEAMRAEIVYASLTRGAVRARMPLDGVEPLAALPSLQRIRFADRAIPSTINVSEGDAAHRADEVRQVFGVTGEGIKIGVISNGVASVPLLQGSGDLPLGVTVLPGQEGEGDEGSAMLEIVHDLAPGADLYFATGANSPESYADNVLALRQAGCDVLVDDLLYLTESPFQDTTVAQAVQAVVDDGAFYFSSAGNGGNLDAGTSSTWEGDFVPGGSLGPVGPGTVNDFGGGVISNRLLANTSVGATLLWADPAGASANDYDLFVLDSDLENVFDFSTDVQDGDDDPYEQIGPSFVDERLVVLKHSGSESRLLYLTTLEAPMEFTTAGCIRGHNSIVGAFATAAVNVATAGGGAFVGGGANPAEDFTCDGPRRIIFEPDGTMITPGDASSTGGVVRFKPDLTAADGVSTATAGFERFFGTSAAAPHAAAIAGLAKGVFPGLTPAAFRAAVDASALDIEAPGPDRDTGAGILMAFQTLEELGAHPAALLELEGFTLTEITGDGDGFLEPGEVASLSVPLANVGGATATALNAGLSTAVPGVTVEAAAATYPALAPGESGANAEAFVISLDAAAECGLVIDLTLAVQYQGGNRSEQSFDLRLVSGRPGAPRTFSYAGAPVPIPDSEVTGQAGEAAVVPITVSGVTGSILDLNFRIDGSLCTAAAGATTVGVDHTFVTDLTFTLESPQGTVATPIELVDLSGNNFCQTLLDDQSNGPSILSVSTADAPFTGSFVPQSPLAVFNGEDPNGTWILRVTDSFPGDVGNVRAVSLQITGAECDLRRCEPGGESLSLQGGRFKVESCYRNQHAGGVEGVGTPIPSSDGSGFFWFFEPDNLELVVKIVNGGPVNGKFWVFYGALSDVEYVVQVTDMETEEVRTYHNPAGTLCGSADVGAFPSAPSSTAAGAPDGSALPQPVWGRLVELPEPLASSALATTEGECSSGPLALCLLDGRFRVEAHWHNQRNGAEGEAHAVTSTDETGLFWFFTPNSIELAVKMLDGTGVNGKFWVFYGALSDVEYTITVTDTATGGVATYTNPPGTLCGGADVNAL